MDPTGTKALTDSLLTFSSGYVRFQQETTEKFDRLQIWCDGMSVAVVNVQEGLATVHADIARLENDMDQRIDRLRDEMNQKFAVLFKHLGIQ